MTPEEMIAKAKELTDILKSEFGRPDADGQVITESLDFLADLALPLALELERVKSEDNWLKKCTAYWQTECERLKDALLNLETYAAEDSDEMKIIKQALENDQ